MNIAKIINYFLTKQGISSDISTHSILTGESLDYKKHLTLQPGQYCQVQDNEEPRYSDKARTQGAICRGPCGNLQCVFKFMSLQAGHKITRYNWDEIPIPQTAINRVNVLGKDQPEHFIFTDRKFWQIGESEITGVEGDQNVKPQMMIEEDDDLYEQDVVNEELAAHPTEYEDYLEEDLNQELTTESLFEDISDQQEENTVKEFQEYPFLDQTSKIKTTSEEPNQSTGVSRSTRSKVQFKDDYVPSISGMTYEKVMAQLDKLGTLHPDAHLLFNLSVEEQPSVVSAIIKELFLKVG